MDAIEKLEAWADFGPKSREWAVRRTRFGGYMVKLDGFLPSNNCTYYCDIDVAVTIALKRWEESHGRD